jgi:hypothetical protein|tara:strand:- start:6104 stop:6550 length:447 start_codon:yes stop_codon:yes gene_type:complete
MLWLPLSCCELLQHDEGWATSALVLQHELLSTGFVVSLSQHELTGSAVLFTLLSESPNTLTIIPAYMALATAAIGLMMANNGPSNAYDTDTLSTPVSGVETRNEIVEDFEAPLRLRPNAAGITPQEHKGKGAPITAALLIDPIELLPM